jgi:hypothetical protein
LTQFQSATHYRSDRFGFNDGAMTELSDVEMIDLFRQQLSVMREWRNSVSTHMAASQEMIKHSRALIVQIDEQISQMERELGLGGRPQSGSRSSHHSARPRS